MIPPRPMITLTATLGAVLAGGCALITGPDPIHVGIIAWGEAPPESGLAADYDDDYTNMDAPVLENPDTVEAGEPFEILVRTFGPDSCWEEAGAEVDGAGQLITVTPYDRDARVGSREVACAHTPVRPRRTVSLVLPEPGEGVIRVTGARVIGAESESRDQMVMIERTVVVR